MASIVQRPRQRWSKAQRRLRRQRQTRKARIVRRQLVQMQAQLPRLARTFFDALGRAFTNATALRFIVLLGAALLTTGKHTIANLLRTLAAISHHRLCLAQGGGGKPGLGPPSRRGALRASPPPATAARLAFGTTL